MFSGKKLIISITSLILITNLTFASWKDDSKVIEICGGEDYTLILTQNNWLWACGNNSYYQLGIGEDTTNQFSPVRVHDGDMVTESGYLENIYDFDSGWMHSLALDVNRFVWAWGKNQYGQLGDGTISEKKAPVQVHDGDMNTTSGYLENIIDVACGRSGAHSLAVDTNHFVWAWGLNDVGQLGNGGVGTQHLTPVQTVTGEMEGGTHLRYIIAVSGGEDNSIALDTNGFVWTWGINDFGQLGNGSTVEHADAPVQVKAGRQDPCNPNSFLKDIFVIDSGWDHLLAVEKYDPFDPNHQGRVYSWGRNSKNNEGYTNYGGQLGDGTENDSNTPVIVLSGQQDPNDPNSPLKNIIAVSAGDSHSMALDIYGNVWTWGDNEYGQLGIYSNDPCRLTPVKVVGPDLNHNGTHEPNEGYLENIVAISAGYWHCIAIDAAGTVWTWGKHVEGSLGLGTAIGENDRKIPHPIGVVYNLTRQTFHFGIQPAINDANNTGNILEASPATYFEDVDFLTKTITLKSTNPISWNVVEDTIIHGSGTNDKPSAVGFNNNLNSRLTGFTITNGIYGIYCSSSSIQITNCIIRDNSSSGIYCFYPLTVIIKNNWIFKNGFSSGIYLEQPALAAVIRNNTICRNTRYGIERYSGSAPNISNCIIWGNNSGQLVGCTATYSCIQNWTGGEGNINTDPCFINSDSNNYHLSPDSRCIDNGDPDLIIDPNETDIDGEPRILDGDANSSYIVDMGADEFYWSPDFDRNEIVNFLDYALFASAWLTSSEEPNYNPKFDISVPRDGIINEYDLALFCDYWLWQPAWSQSDPLMMMGAGYAQGAGFTEALSTAPPFGELAETTEQLQTRTTT